MPSSIKLISIPLIVIVFVRLIYAINWFNISSIFYLIMVDFKGDISMLGTITAGFLVGIGIFQIPAGIIAAKYEPKKIAFFGIIVLSTASFLSGLATDLIQMVILRFFVGLGMAFFFGPSVILISSFLGKGSEGLGIGILNSAHSFGGIIGIFGWIVITQLIGWRASLIMSGVLGIVSGIFLIYVTRQSKFKKKENIGSSENKSSRNFFGNFIPLYKPETGITNSAFKIKMDDIKIIVFNKSMIIIGLSLLGVQIGWNLVSTFIVIYLKNGLHINPLFAGLVGGIPMIFNVISSPIFGNIYDKTKRKSNSNLGLLLLVISGLIVSINIAFFSFANLYAIIVSIMLVGIFISGGFVVPYTKAREITTKDLNKPNYETFAISFINGLSLFGAFWVPSIFSSIVKNFDYSLAWLTGGILTFIFIIPVFYLRNK
ncbi:MAG: MFS transporter [Candidatus Nitrosocosmicus sp.]